MWFFALYPILTHIKGAVARPELLKVRIPIIARADDVNVLLSFTQCEPARTGTITITFFINQERLNQFQCEILIRVKQIPCLLCLFFQLLVNLDDQVVIGYDDERIKGLLEI